MTSNRLKSLAKFRLILSVIAVLLAGLMVVSGVMHFRIKEPASPGGEYIETMIETVVTTAPETTETAETEVPTIETPVSTDAEEAIENTAGSNEGTSEENPLKRGVIGPEPDIAATEETEINIVATEEIENDIATAEEAETGTAATEEAETGTAATGEAETDTAATEEAETDTAATEEAETDIATTEETEDLPKTERVDSDQNIVTAKTEQKEEGNSLWGILFWFSSALLATDIVAIMFVSRQIEQERKRLKRIKKSLAKTDMHARHPDQTTSDILRPAVSVPTANGLAEPMEVTQLMGSVPRVGTIHQVGRRDYQQDSLGHATILEGKGFLAVLADGMGGLSGGEKVSQKIVMDALTMGHQLKQGQVNGVLWKMVDKVNENTNRMLGPDGLYKSGSTLVAILVYDGQFQWIAVGDSRIYLYRQGYANQLNQDHDQLQVWMADVLSGRRTMEDVLSNPDGRKLTSFIGMGQLKYVDGSRGAIPLEPGDRLVLMSDGIYNVISEDRLAEVLKLYPDEEQAASVIERMIRDSNHPHQDNYTAIVLGF